MLNATTDERPAAEMMNEGIGRDGKPEVWYPACKALGKIGPAAVPALIETLADVDWRIRAHAWIALGDIGPAAKDAVPCLIDALRHEKDDYVRSNADEALMKIRAGK